MLLFNCSVNKQPEFLGLKNIAFIDSSLKHVTLSADAYFNNPNDIKGTLYIDDLKVYINAVEVAQFVSKEFKVPSKKEFSIPLTVSLATDSILKKKAIGGILGSLISEQLDIAYKGNIKYKVLGHAFTYTIDESQRVKVNL